MVLEKILNDKGLNYAIENDFINISKTIFKRDFDDYFVKSNGNEIQPATVDMGFLLNDFCEFSSGNFSSNYESVSFMKAINDYIPKKIQKKIFFLAHELRDQINKKEILDVLPPYSINQIHLNDRITMNDMIMRVTAKSCLGRIGLTTNHPFYLYSEQKYEKMKRQFSFTLTNKTSIPWRFKPCEKIVQAIFQPIDINLEPLYDKSMYGTKTGKFHELTAGNEMTIIRYDELITQLIENSDNVNDMIMDFDKRNEILKPFTHTIELSKSKPYHVRNGEHVAVKTREKISLDSKIGLYLDDGANAGWVDPGYEGHLFPNPYDKKVKIGDVIAKAYEYYFPSGVQDVYGTKNNTHQNSEKFGL
ncbi:MAG: hypothetical protein GON13_03715 [Nanoarchaeota archaeon]|nr:hypothetical protein [Nanoarchaeota archaeon]